MSDTIFAPGFDKAQAQYDGAEPDELCADCRGDGESCCCQDEDDGPDPDDVRDRRIEREMDS